MEDNNSILISSPSNGSPNTNVERWNMTSSTDTVRCQIGNFLAGFESTYSQLGPLALSFLGPLDEAIKHSLFQQTEAQPLILYLHHQESIAVNIFYDYVLCDDVIIDYLSQNFLIWSWDRTLANNYSTLLTMLNTCLNKKLVVKLTSLPLNAYPLLVCLSAHRGEIDIVSIVEGSMHKVEVLNQLREFRQKFDHPTELPHSISSCANVPNIEHIFTLQTATKTSTLDDIMKKFKESYMKIICIDEIDCVTWHSEYLQKKNSMDTRLGHENNERLLYHGCSRSAAENIIKYGFDHNLIGTHGTAYGHGFYFSSDHRYSNNYAIPDKLSDGKQTMLICQVLVGKTHLGSARRKQCPSEYDSTTNGSEIFVVYSNDQILPKYIVTYKQDYSDFENLSSFQRNALKTSCSIM